MQRIDAVLLAGVGILSVHQGAYTLTALTGTESSIAHGHLQTAWLLASLGVLGVLARSVLRSVKARMSEGVSELALFGWIAAGYFVLEQVERQWDGYGALTLFSEPVFWVGLALAPFVALALSWSIRSLETALHNCVHNQPRVPRSRDCAAPSTSRTNGIPVAQFLLRSAPRRGPPSTLFT